VRNAAAVVASELNFGAFHLRRCWGWEGFTERCFVFAMTAIPSSVADFAIVDTDLVMLTQELVLITRDWWDWSWRFWAKVCFVFAHLTMPSTVANKVDKNATSV
jgi:hypothetical protein